MPILRKSDVAMSEIAPGVERWEIVNGELGTESLTVADLNDRSGIEGADAHPSHRGGYVDRRRRAGSRGSETR